MIEFSPKLIFQNFKILTESINVGHNWGWSGVFRSTIRLLRYKLDEPAAIVTCVSIIVHSKGLVAVLTVSQWGERDQTGVIFSLRGYHVNRGLRGTTAVREILWPLSLTHQAFYRRKTQKQWCHPITQPADSQLFSDKPPSISLLITKTIIPQSSLQVYSIMVENLFKCDTI